MTLQTEIGVRGDEEHTEREPRRGLLVSLASCVLAAVLTGHRAVPGGPGTLLDTALPWLGLLVLPLAVIAAVRRAWWPGLAAVLLPALVWSLMFGGAFLRSAPGGPYDLRVIGQNMYAGNRTPAATAAALLSTRADVLALVELSRGSYPESLDTAFPHHAVKGTVGIWSRFPIRDAEPVDLDMGWTRAMRATLVTPKGDITTYVAHLASARPGYTSKRDATMHRLSSTLRADRSKRILLLGDLNTATTDRKLGELVPPLREAHETAGSGMGFTWPGGFPLTRPDHILYAGLDAVNAATVATPGSDHHAVQADFRL
ncbi:endonuclease/exonuclease/phosphatase family protein [Actinomadura fulvescens]|uniref:Endonuclease/exonuclease/phosphatase family protein n=1 Tax=Actinomadura fulvescens TaxID=46160 RepID=A0ABN3PB29_9ACTN